MIRTLFRALVAIHLLVGATCAQAQFTDDFEDGDFSANPAWTGIDALFTIVDQGGNMLLRSNSPGAANYHLTTPSTLASDARWEWFIDLRFATSGANYVDVYLMSDNADLGAAQNGWFVRIGGTQDRVELFKRVDGANASVLVSPDGIVNSSTSNPFRIRAERTAANDWTLYFDDGNTGAFASMGPTTDAAVGTSAHFGLLVVQSSAAGPINNHFFDDFVVGSIPVDLTPPQIQGATVVSATQVDLQFNEALSAGSVTALSNYAVTGGLVVSGAALTAASTIQLTLSTPMQNNTTYTVTVNGVEDLAGNACVDQSADFLLIVPDAPVFRDVVINEFMADPSPVVGLPDAEFVEIFNATADKTFDLAGWKFTDGTSTATLPTYALGPGQHVIVVSESNSPLFASVANRIGVVSLPSLNNDSDNLALTAPDNTLIDAVSYALNWYRDSNKQDGGWTLEQINPFTPCSGASNWIASNSPIGGTPGEPNSVLDPTPDSTPPSLISVQVVDGTTIDLVFDEPMNSASLGAATYLITPTITVSSAQAVSGTDNRARLTLASAITVGVVYTIAVSGPSDCTGNAIGTANTGTFALPEPVAIGDLVINEVLYDPISTGSDFVELYNRSQKTLSLAYLQMANETNGAIANIRTITGDPILLLPGEYILLTPSAPDIAARYPQSRTDRFVEMSLPSYNNGNGSVVLLDPSNAVLDLFRYDDDMHFTLVNKPEGYSLERVDPFRATDDPTNWHTASDMAGKATPGFQNSQYSLRPDPSGEMTIEPSIFSPDQDGYQDLLTIAYSFNQPGFVGTIIIYDVAGREARKLMENQLLGAEGAISWDGILDSGGKGRMGPYIVVMEAYDLAGNVETFRKTVTLAHRLN
ncbi:MAG: lamin tail domain-containing protein [Flavobacteriales bacterium]|nr:lamin tail domain-containing protein [Flavobacteriales bacterium]